MTESTAVPATIGGIHHVTAIASDPQQNLDFYVRFLGMRLVKRTVNFDDPGTYHFYYGDETGKPGTILTFFPWPGARRGRHGTGQVTATAFAVPFDSLAFWSARAGRFGFSAEPQPDRFGQRVLRIEDADGLIIELTESVPPAESIREEGDGADIPGDYRVRCIHSATLAEQNENRTRELLTGMMGFRETGRESERIRFEVADGGTSKTIDLVIDPAAQRGLGGAGTVHHIAYRTPDDVDQLEWQQSLMAAGYQVSPVMDRNYFHSIYYREPGGILFEIATDLPGFLVDETFDDLGTALRLPLEYESTRSRIEAALPAITVPVAGTLTESY